MLRRTMRGRQVSLSRGCNRENSLWPTVAVIGNIVATGPGPGGTGLLAWQSGGTRPSPEQADGHLAAQARRKTRRCRTWMMKIGKRVPRGTDRKRSNRELSQPR
jgi:hypothetical protein